MNDSVRQKVNDAASHLRTALAQSLWTDDKIIIGHMRDALQLLEDIPAASLLYAATDPIPEGCYCKPGQCMAPVIMGRQMPCRDPKKAAEKCP